jgi:hypothetical protein
VLPAGLVCDPCNNYFGRKLEFDILDSSYFKNLRSRQALKSRRGKPIFAGMTVSVGGARFRATFSGNKEVSIHSVSIDGKTTLQEAFARDKGGKIWIPLGGDSPDDKLISRFLGKVGLEMLAARFHTFPDFEDMIFQDQLDPIRRWSRYGQGVKSWPFNRRRLYDEDSKHSDVEATDFQMVHEFDLLLTDAHELYAIVCIFGEEFVINMAGPSLEGYEAWLMENNGTSPLYSGKNRPPAI